MVKPRDTCGLTALRAQGEEPGRFSTDGHRVSVAFFTRALDGVLHKATSTEDVSSMDAMGLRVVLDINVKKGATRATAETYNGCHIGYHGFKASPVNHGDNANGPKSCGWDFSVVATLRAAP